MAKKSKQTTFTEDIQLPLQSVIEKKYPWRTSFNNRYRKTLGEVNFLASETRPDEVMSIREIETRYAGGKSLMDVLPRPIWDTEEEITFDDYLPDLRTLDHADRLDLMEKAQFELDEIKKKANDLAKQRKVKKDADEAEAKKQAAKEIAAILASQNGSGGTPDPQ